MDLVEPPQLAGFTITLTQVQVLIAWLDPSFHAFSRKNMDDHSILLEVPVLLMDSGAFLRAVLQNHPPSSDIEAQALWAAEENLLPAGVLQVLLLPVVTARSQCHGAAQDVTVCLAVRTEAKSSVVELSREPGPVIRWVQLRVDIGQKPVERPASQPPLQLQALCTVWLLQPCSG